MKNAMIALISAVMLIAACSDKKPQPKYQPGTPEYAFFEKVAEKVPVLNPNENNVLVSTSEFSVYISDVAQPLYQTFRRFEQNIETIPVNNVTDFLKQFSTQKAERELMLLAANKSNITVPQDSLTKRLVEIYTRFGGEDKFVEYLAKQGLDLEFVKKDVKESSIIQKYLQDVVFNVDDNISDEELKEAYDKDKTASVRHILFKTQGKSDTEKEEIRQKAEKVLAEAKDGKDFAGLAKEYSEDPGSKDNGGLYEDFERGRMVKPFNDASFSLPIGAISDLVETQFGFHIIKIIDRKKETRPFDEVKDELKNSVSALKKSDAYTNAVESLKEEYKYTEHFENL